MNFLIKIILISKTITMKNPVQLKTFAMAVFMFPALISYSQTKAEKKASAKGVSMGMYNSSQSKEALKFYQDAALLAEKNDYKGAIKLYEKSIKEDPKFVEAYDNMARCYRRLGDFDNAIKNYKKSIELFPDGNMAHQNLGMIYGIQKEYDKAFAEYEIVQKINPDDAEGYYGTIQLYLNKGDYKSAIKNATKTLEIYEATNNPFLTDAQYLLGLSYYYDDDMKNAKVYIEQAKKGGFNVSEKLLKDLKIK